MEAMPAQGKFLFSFFIVAAIFLFLPRVAQAVISINITSSPTEARIGEEFTVSLSMDGLEPETSYYIKSRIGKTSSEMNKGETFNESTSRWLGDTDAWTNFPIILSNSEGSSSANLKSRAKSTAELGENLLAIRLRKVGASSNAGDSNTVTINLFEAPTPAPSPTPTPQPTLTPTSSSSLTPTPTPKSPTPTPKPPTATPTQKSSPSTSTQVPTSTPTPKPVKLTATIGGEILGGEESSPGAFYPWEASEEAKSNPESNPSFKNPQLPKIFLILGGLAFLACGIILAWRREKTS